MSFFKFNERCYPILGDVPNASLSICAIVLGQILPFIFFSIRSSPRIVSISETWREIGSVGSVHAFIMYVMIVYVGMCSDSVAFRIVVSIACALILCVFWVNADVHGVDNLPLGLSKKTKLLIKSWHLKLALFVFLLLLVATILIVNYEYGWPFDNNLNIDQKLLRSLVLLCMCLEIICIVGMIGIMISRKINREEPWTTAVSCLEHAYFDLFWIVYGFVKNGS